MIVAKAVKMAEMMSVPIVGMVENMSYFRCPDNGKDYQIFGESHIGEIADAYHIPLIVKLPIDPELARACDRGTIELFEGDWLDALADAIIVFENLDRRNENA